MSSTTSRVLRTVMSFAIAFAVVALAGNRTYSQAAQGPGAAAAPTPVAIKGTLERITVHGKSLEGNLLGETAAPEVSIYLPPGYATDRDRRYPVVYLLHGYTGTDLRYFGATGRQLHVVAERAFASGRRAR